VTEDTTEPRKYHRTWINLGEDRNCSNVRNSDFQDEEEKKSYAGETFTAGQIKSFNNKEATPGDLGMEQSDSVSKRSVSKSVSAVTTSDDSTSETAATSNVMYNEGSLEALHRMLRRRNKKRPTKKYPDSKAVNTSKPVNTTTLKDQLSACTDPTKRADIERNIRIRDNKRAAQTASNMRISTMIDNLTSVDEWKNPRYQDNASSLNSLRKRRMLSSQASKLFLQTVEAVETAERQ